VEGAVAGGGVDAAGQVEADGQLRQVVHGQVDGVAQDWGAGRRR
jgi:hypothetical protein